MLREHQENIAVFQHAAFGFFSFRRRSSLRGFVCHLFQLFLNAPGIRCFFCRISSLRAFSVIAFSFFQRSGGPGQPSGGRSDETKPPGFIPGVRRRFVVQVSQSAGGGGQMWHGVGADSAGRVLSARLHEDGVQNGSGEESLCGYRNAWSFACRV